MPMIWFPLGKWDQLVHKVFSGAGGGGGGGMGGGIQTIIWKRVSRRGRGWEGEEGEELKVSHC